MTAVISPILFANKKRESFSPPSMEQRNRSAVKDILVRMRLSDAKAIDDASVTAVESDVYLVEKNGSRYIAFDSKLVDRFTVSGVVAIRDGVTQASILSGDGVSSKTTGTYAGNSSPAPEEIALAAVQIATGYLNAT